jgi:transcriptional regulator with XRE-family HTH domain
MQDFETRVPGNSMSLAARLRKLREDREMSLDDVATKANISKTYLWELERDTCGAKKPSADVLIRIANALSTTLAELLSLATVRIQLYLFLANTVRRRES